MKPHVLLLPGMMLDKRMWLGQIEALRDIAGCTVGDLCGADSMDALAHQQLEAAPPRFHLIGFSMGAIVAMAMWRLDPSRIASMALLGFSPHADDPARRVHRERHMARAQCGELAALVRDEMAPRYFSPHADAADVERWTEAVVEMAATLGADAFCRQSLAQMGRADSLPTLPTVNVRTLLLCGADDALVAATDQRAMQQALPRAELVFIPRAGHMITLERPGSVNDSLHTFLKKVIDEQSDTEQDARLGTAARQR